MFALKLVLSPSTALDVVDIVNRASAMVRVKAVPGPPNGPPPTKVAPFARSASPVMLIGPVRNWFDPYTCWYRATLMKPKRLRLPLFPSTVASSIGVTIADAATGISPITPSMAATMILRILVIIPPVERRSWPPIHAKTIDVAADTYHIPRKLHAG